ncbi:NOB1 family endonuclease [Candidatus Nitrosotenuis uzonensis]|uniref:Endoribonuclease Nob1 n=1 Tax=Candidatus Nitrosotenuis uzonensis TaxID=1407055 RepID=V6AS78_9ARCH|nr:nucleotide-binding protein [Candidatus Nitrosotenuis uzonensis]CDI05278.1 putative PIN domain protein [Candidatus Nitrosotenuis uzonensis]
MGFRIYDASAFYAGIPFASPELGHTTSLVFEEIEHIKKCHGAIEILIQTGRLKIMDAEPQSIKVVVDMAKKTGDFQELSKADISAVALALQTGGHIVTDDFAVSNLAKNMKISIHPVMTNGIRDVGRWRHYCSACKKEFTAVNACPICGNRLTRKLLKRKPS